MYLMIGAHTTCGDSTQGTRTWTEAEEQGALGGAGSPGERNRTWSWGVNQEVFQS